MRVITRAYGDRPLSRIIAGYYDEGVFVINPSVNRSAEEIQSSGVGFASRYVFEFSESLFRKLEQAWDSDDRAGLSDLWENAKPYENTHASRG